MTAAQNANRTHASIRTLWGLAKSPELALDESALYDIIGRETGKDHMKELTQGELDKVARVLGNMKDGVERDLQYDATHKRTDEGGNPGTVKLRHKIYALTGELGWNDDNSRINGFCKRMCGVDRIEWLSVPQCSLIIEALKKMVGREGKEAGTPDETKTIHPKGETAPG